MGSWGVWHFQVGSADHNIHYFDLRNTSTPVHVFRGHKKAVSYVKFLSNNELASASTDSTLRLWDVKDNTAVRLLSFILIIFQGLHMTYFANCVRSTFMWLVVLIVIYVLSMYLSYISPNYCIELSQFWFSIQAQKSSSELKYHTWLCEERKAIKFFGCICSLVLQKLNVTIYQSNFSSSH